MSEGTTSVVHPGLWLVATPIGNMEDIAPRAPHVLRGAAMILCEDTRHSGSLLKRIGVTGARLVVANDHTEHDAAGVMLGALASGAVVAVITDAGSPGVSDPGERLVRAAIEAGHPVHAVPGPAAFVMAATVSGLPTARIAFEEADMPKLRELVAVLVRNPRIVNSRLYLKKIPDYFAQRLDCPPIR
ncbi:MAG: 16S rRNA (cytidine(1402)-2'-O)-methyltransferase, partial [Ilumatobacteraceae bacterium]